MNQIWQDQMMNNTREEIAIWHTLRTLPDEDYLRVRFLETLICAHESDAQSNAARRILDTYYGTGTQFNVA